MKVVLSSLALEALEHAAEQADVGLRRSYPGRGMHGRSCVAVTGNLTGLVRFVLTLTEEVANALPGEGERLAAFLDELRESRTLADQLGKDTVYYWPTVELEEA